MPVQIEDGLSHAVMQLDEPREVQRIAHGVREVLSRKLHRRGLVVAVSGGIDSSVCAALAVEAIGPERVFGLLLPERDSSAESLRRGRQLVDHLGIDHQVEDIAPALQAIGCYRWRDEAIRRVFPGYGQGWKSKLAIAAGESGRFSFFRLVVETPQGEIYSERLRLKEYLQIVAATNYKQRIRKSIEYFHADRLNYAVVGTPNRLEYDQGFFVKNGDGAADIKPIAHLYKSQVYALAHHLGLPEEIRLAAPTTDTYSMPQGQDEFYFSLPYRQMDLALWARNHHVAPEELAEVLQVDVEQAISLYTEIDAKRRATAYLHESAVLVGSVPEI